MLSLFKSMGVKTTVPQDGCVEVRADDLSSKVAHYDLVKTMRASFLVLGPLLARFGHARVSLPGGCAIGTRPVDQHLKALRALGANIDVEDGYVVAEAPNGLRGAEFEFDLVTVTGTQNAIFAAVLAEGETELRKVAQEPEIGALVSMLNRMGAKISGAGTDTLRISGRTQLAGCQATVPPDRIEVGTYLLAAAATRGEVSISNSPTAHLTSVLSKLEETGAAVSAEHDRIKLNMNQQRPKAVAVSTAEYPGIPTDLQAQFMAMNCVAEGQGKVVENIFENRFMHVQELVRLGAKIKLNDHTTAITHGNSHLKGARVMATDLRASSCLVIAGLAAKGETMIDRIYHLDRGYEQMEHKLRMLDADIERTK